ncbi:MAG: phosphatidate cytidylyltransferase [Candidatus Binatia bacterium]|nr:phosphatidate cytidylyltransferase [Candidatus Binatia bacterium]
MLRARLATAAVALPSLFWLIFSGPNWAFAGLIVAVTAIGLFEFVGMSAPEHRGSQAFSILAGLLFAGTVILHRTDALGLVLCLVLAVGLILALADPDMRGAVDRLAHSLLAALYVGLFLPHAVRLHALPEGGPRWVFFVIACTMAADTAAYFGGRFAGKTKLFPRVSPNKTVEGAIAALGGALLIAWLVAWLLPPPGLTMGSALWLGLIIWILSQTGDMIESMLKRAYDTKDSGWILPGHGGVLDRIDALVLPFVFTYYWNTGLGL